LGVWAKIQKLFSANKIKKAAKAPALPLWYVAAVQGAQLDEVLLGQLHFAVGRSDLKD